MAKQTTPKTTPSKATTKKPAVTKTAPKKKAAPARKSLKTSIVAYTDVGFGNTLYIRGEGAGLSWEQGTPLKNISATEWSFDTTKAKNTITFKFLINDQIWAEGDDIVTKAGSKSVNSPEFVW